ncbi:hypothetical protein ACSBR2_014646 [Camellia fascicularis]
MEVGFQLRGGGKEMEIKARMLNMDCSPFLWIIYLQLWMPKRCSNSSHSLALYRMSLFRSKEGLCQSQDLDL